jgi:hypothetical protein
VAAITAMVLLLVFQGYRHPPAPAPAIAKAPANRSAPKVAAVTPPVRPPIRRRRQRETAPSRVDTRPQQFPTPRPLSEQEKLLRAYVRSLQGSSAPSVLDADENSERDTEIPPLSITAIKIEPLVPPKDIGDEK